MRAPLSLSVIALLLALFIITPVPAAALDNEYNKNGEVYVLLKTASGGDCVKAGIYKTCEYSVDDTGQRNVIVAKPNNIDNVRLNQGQDLDLKNYGLAVNKDRMCYTFTDRVSPTWTAAGPNWKVKAKARWLVGNECVNDHFAHGHGRGKFYWYGSGTTLASGNYIPVTNSPSLTGPYDASGDGRFTTLTGNTAIFPCSVHHQGWTSGPWPDPIGPWDNVTVNGTVIKKSRSDEYMMPMGIGFHNLNDPLERHSLPYVYIYMGAVKPTDLVMHIWESVSPTFPVWTKDSQTMPNYNDNVQPDVVFQLFEARYHIFITTPCGDNCMARSAGDVQAAGNSEISVTITPFGRAYGLQVVRTNTSEMISIKRYDKGAPPISYEPSNWRGINPPLHLKVIRSLPGSTLTLDNWSQARRIATSYKFKASETVATKEEYVYLCDSEFFCVADTWFGDGGRAFFGKGIYKTPLPAPPAKPELLGVELASETRNEVSGATEDKFFRIMRKVQDIAADGYGNLFVLCTTGLDQIDALMDRNINDFTALKTALTKPDEWGYVIVDPASYVDNGWVTVDTRRLRTVEFDLIIYKTIYKINSNTIDDKGTSTAGAAKDMMTETTPIVVGNLKVGRVRCSRVAEQNGAVVRWAGKVSAATPVDFEAELAAINIAAPPEEQGANYYIDVTGPSTGKPGTGEKDRATKSTDTVFEGEESVWMMENSPEFDNIYGLNLKAKDAQSARDEDDQNKNGIVGSLRNNIIRESLAYHWYVYRLFDIEQLALPDPPVENETFATQKAAGKYGENLLFEKHQIFAGTGTYARKKGGTNQSLYGTQPGYAAVADPFTLRHTFREAGIYKVCLKVDFDYYKYSDLGFGSNRGARDGVKQSSDDLAVPAFFKSNPKFPVFNHKEDTRFVVVLARDALADDDHIRKVKVSVMAAGSESPLGALDIPEVDRSRDVVRGDIPSLYRDKVGERQTKLTQVEEDSQRMTTHDVVGDFAIRFVSALPGLGDEPAPAGTDRDKAEKFGGVGCADYDPDEVWNYTTPGAGRDEVGGTSPFKVAAKPGTGTNRLHPTNYKLGTSENDVTNSEATTFQVTKNNDPTKDRLALVQRNYGLSGHGTLVRALSPEKLAKMQVNMDPKERSFLKWYEVPDSQWNGGKADDGKNYPIREVDWDHVAYQWTIDYKAGSTVMHEEPAAYRGTVGELLRFYYNDKRGFDAHGFIAHLGTKAWTDPAVGDPRNIFNEGTANRVDIEQNKIPAYHVRIPMLERVTLPSGQIVFKGIRWETPLAPETYKIGLRVWADAVKWQQDKSYKITAEKKEPSGAITEFKDKQVFWDIVYDRTNSAKCDPLSPSSLTGPAIFVIDREPPRFKRTGADATTAADFNYTGGTTGDKYTAKSMEFKMVENNPNISAAFRRYLFMGGATAPDDGFSMDYPLNLAGGSTHTAEKYMFKMKTGDYDLQDGTPGNCFDFVIDPTKEEWGAPYAMGPYILPVGGDGRVDGDVRQSDLTTFDLKSSPFMMPDYIGRLPYKLNFKIPAGFVAGMRAAPEASVLVVPNDYLPGMFFEVADNDPPQIFVDVLTSYTEIDKFGFAAMDDTRAKYDFAAKTFPLNTYRSLLNGNDPKAWPAALLDLCYPAAENGNGKGLDYGDTYVMSLGDRQLASTLAAGASDNRTVEVAGITVFIPEKSRAVFTIKAVDNVPRAGSYIVDLGDDNFNYEMSMTSGGKGMANEITKAEDVTDPTVMQVYGIFRLPNAVATETNKLKLRVGDGPLGAGGTNQSEVDVNVNVINTFLKQEKLDMENTKIDSK